MEEVKCNSCNYKLEKPTLESLIYTVKKAGGNVLTDICPNCKRGTLKVKLIK